VNLKPLVAKVGAATAGAAASGAGGAGVTAGVVVAAPVLTVKAGRKMVLLTRPEESVTVKVQSKYWPSARLFKAMVLLPVTAAVVELRQLPVKLMVPAAVELKVKLGVAVLTVAGMGVTRAMTGAPDALAVVVLPLEATVVAAPKEPVNVSVPLKGADVLPIVSVILMVKGTTPGVSALVRV